MLKKLLLLILCIVLAYQLNIYINQAPYPSDAVNLPAQVSLDGGGSPDPSRHRSFAIHDFPVKGKPKALILFGSGDGGWMDWEERTARALQDNGYAVMGIDCNDYAATDYNLATIQADYATIAREGLKAFGWFPPPLIIGGWSMGAVQAIAVAGGPHRPPGVVGVLLLSAGSRGRYGVRVVDRMDILPTGPGTFAVADFSPGLDGLRVLQWHGETDSVDSTAWLANLKADHLERDFKGDGHDYGGPNAHFKKVMPESVEWIWNFSFSPDKK